MRRGKYLIRALVSFVDGPADRRSDSSPYGRGRREERASSMALGPTGQKDQRRRGK